MSETLHNNINMSSVSDDTHKILLVDETNRKSHNNEYKNCNDDDLEKNIKINDQSNAKNNQKSKIYLNDHFIMILLLIVGLLFLIVIALTIVSLLHCYSTKNHFKKSTNESITPINNFQNNQNKTIIGNLVQPEIVGTGRAKYVDDAVHYDYEN